MNSSTRLSAQLATIPRDAKDNSRYGSAFEFVSDFALRNAYEYGDQIATIEAFRDWAIRSAHYETVDRGVDRVITTKAGELWTVQNKGYADDRRVDQADFNAFVMQSDSLNGVTRSMVSSGPGLNANAEKSRKGSKSKVVILNRLWLSRAAEYPSTFEELRSTSTGKRAIPSAYELRNHQKAAVHDLARGLQKSRSVQYLSACGTGKTVTSIGLADRLEAGSMAYFVPTLGLMRQTIDAVRRQHVGRRRLITVAACSDPTVAGERERETTSEEDLSCEVFHTAKELAEFFAEHQRDGARLVIFCTYASAPVVVDAQHKYGLQQIDLAFCDEAHNLVGASSARNIVGELVKDRDDNILRFGARWRVYATATARSVTARAQARAAKVKMSLDSMGEYSPVFGPVAHSYTLGEAIAEGILTDYQVCVVITPTEEWAEVINARTYVQHGGDGEMIDAGMYAALKAVREAYARGDRRIITYHRRLDEAAQFARLIDEDPDLPGAVDIHGKLPAGERDDRIARLENDGGYVITNPKCLTQGIDLPDLDAIVFADPKSSPGIVCGKPYPVVRAQP